MFKISVIIPVYNTEQYLDACLKSVIHQTLKEIEVILIDDGSTDSSFSIMERYQKQYPDRIKLIRKENGGQATARNMAIPVCTGEYIGFVDSDDVIKPDMYEKMYLAAVKNDADYAECDYVNVKVNERGEEIRIADYGSRVRAYTSKKDMFLDPMLAPWNKIYRRDKLQKSGITFPEGLIYEDTGFCLKCISFIENYTFVPEKFVVHYHRASSTMNINKARKVGDILPVLDDMLRYYRDRSLFETYRDELEYETVKICLCSSVMRISKVRDKTLRRELCDRTWAFVTKYFPYYKQNCYIRRRGLKNRYMQMVTGRTLPWFCNLFARKKEA